MNERTELVDALAVANEDRALLREALVRESRQRVAAERQRDETERWLRQLEQSRIWKLTGPLRDAGAAYRWLSQRLKTRSSRRV
jgi:hypothetical protein